MQGTIRRWTRLLTIAATVALLGRSLAAQGGETGFVPAGADDLVKENLPATPLVFAAYATVWVVLVIYVFTLWRRVRSAEREIADLNARLEARH